MVINTLYECKILVSGLHTGISPYIVYHVLMYQHVVTAVKLNSLYNDLM